MAFLSVLTLEQLACKKGKLAEKLLRSFPARQLSLSKPRRLLRCRPFSQSRWQERKRDQRYFCPQRSWRRDNCRSNRAPFARAFSQLSLIKLKLWVLQLPWAIVTMTKLRLLSSHPVERLSGKISDLKSSLHDWLWKSTVFPTDISPPSVCSVRELASQTRENICRFFFSQKAHFRKLHFISPVWKFCGCLIVKEGSIPSLHLPTRLWASGACVRLTVSSCSPLCLFSAKLRVC